MAGGGEGVSFSLNKNGHKLAYEKVSGSAPNILYIPGMNGQYSRISPLYCFHSQDLCLARMEKRRST